MGSFELYPTHFNQKFPHAESDTFYHFQCLKSADNSFELHRNDPTTSTKFWPDWQIGKRLFKLPVNYSEFRLKEHSIITEEIM